MFFTPVLLKACKFLYLNIQPNYIKIIALLFIHIPILLILILDYSIIPIFIVLDAYKLKLK